MLVGHNLRFDTVVPRRRARAARLRTARATAGSTPSASRAASCARRDVANHKLGTLARHFGTAAEPNHRAFDDAAATAEVLHGLIEDAAGFGVFGLDDLLALPKVRDHPSSTKLALTAALPRATRRVLVPRPERTRAPRRARPTNLRARVRSYFAGRSAAPSCSCSASWPRSKHVECADDLEAAVRELRLVRRHRPRYNPSPAAPSYVKLTLGERFPRIAVVRTRPRRRSGVPRSAPVTGVGPPGEGGDRGHVPLRRCTTRLPRPAPGSCPCGGSLAVRDVRPARGTGGRGHRPATPAARARAARRRLGAAVDGERFEDAARTRDRLTALAAGLRSRRRLDAIRDAGRFCVAPRRM